MNRPSLPAPLDKRYGYHAARFQARAVRSIYTGPLGRRLARRPAAPVQLDAHLVLFSGERDAAEQVASLRSFIVNVGRPARVTLGSDGTHTARTLARLRELYDGLEVVPPDVYLGADLPEAVRRFAADFVSGRKLAFYLSLQPDYPFVYADSDVLFFPGAAAIRDLLTADSEAPLYLVDGSFYHDERMLSEDLLEAPPVNSGFWILRAPIDWGEALERLASVEGSFRFHTEQTVLHVAMHRGGGEPVDARRYVMGVRDRFAYRTRPERDQIVMRHYVTGIRHHFWLNVARSAKRRPARGRRTPRAHFLHVGKTAGTSVRDVLLPHRKAGRYALEFHPHSVTLRDIPLDDAFYFIVRDPISRFVSGFYSRQRQGRPRYDNPWTEVEQEAFARFDTANELGEALASPDPGVRAEAERAMRGIGHVRTSYWDWFIDEPTLRAAADQILFVGFQETLDEDFPGLLQALGLDPRISLPTDDVRAHRTPDSVDRRLSDVAREALHDWYAADYEFVDVCRELAASKAQWPRQLSSV